MILDSYFKAIGQMGDKRFRKVLFAGVGLTVGLLAAITIALSVLAGLVIGPVTLPLVGEISWLGSVASWAIVGLMVVLSPFLMVPVSVAFMGIFLDQVADAVEERHYPGLPEAGEVTIWDGLRDSGSLIVITVLVNIVALIMSFFIGPLAPILFWLVNGYLLGREFFQLAAIRREGRAGANALRAQHTGKVWMAGTLVAIPLTVPLLNLIVPLIGAATFTHLYHRVTGQQPTA